MRTGHEFILAKCLEKVFLFLSCISTKKTRRSPPQRRGRLLFAAKNSLNTKKPGFLALRNIFLVGHALRNNAFYFLYELVC